MGYNDKHVGVVGKSVEDKHSTSLAEHLSEMELNESKWNEEKRNMVSNKDDLIIGLGNDGDMCKTQRSVAHPSGAALYVGNLSPRVIESDLREVFESVGIVVSVRICKDAISGKSLGYGYVNLSTVSDGEKAIETLNHYTLYGHQFRVMWSQRDPSSRRTGEGNILVKNLNKNIDNRMLHDTFEVFGKINSCKVVYSENGESKGFGFIHFQEKESAEDAITMVNGKMLNGSKVNVCHHIPAILRKEAVEEFKKQYTNVYVKGFDSTLTQEDLINIFKHFGKIQSCQVNRDEEGNNVGFGFVNYYNHEDAEKAVAEMHEKVFDGKELYVSRAMNKEERLIENQKKFEEKKNYLQEKYKGANLYIRNLCITIDDVKLREYFQKCGEIVSSQVMKNSEGISRGFGFVSYNTPECAIEAIREYNGKIIEGKPLLVCFALSKEERTKILAEQYQRRYQEKMRELLPSKYTQTLEKSKPVISSLSHRPSVQRGEGSRYGRRGGERYPRGDGKKTEGEKGVGFEKPKSLPSAKELARMSEEKKKVHFTNSLREQVSSQLLNKKEAEDVVQFILSLDDSVIMDVLYNQTLLGEKISEALDKLNTKI